MMKQMTKSELLATPLGEFLELNRDNKYLISKNINVCGQFSLVSLGIELIEEKPPITIENLGRFMAKYGEYPKADFTEQVSAENNAPKRSLGGRLSSVNNGLYLCVNSDSYFYKCDITDPRWTAENLGGEG